MTTTNCCNCFSILMAVYHKDDPSLFRVALESVYNNKLQPASVVVVQDGPVGKALSNVISEYKLRQSFRLIELPVNKGLANALNTGLLHIATPFVLRADADDYNLPDRFEKQISMLESGYDLVGGAIMEVDKTGKSIAIRSVPTSQDEIRRFISKRNPFNHMTVAYRRSAVTDLGGYPDIFLKEDYALWASMLSNGAKMINLDDVLVNATAGSEMYKRRGGVKYVRSEIDMQTFLIKKGLQSALGAIFIGVSRSMVFLMPAFLRGFIYEKFLRKSV
jgi:glycosyltransferase involved in cell wall biosynthesis